MIETDIRILQRCVLDLQHRVQKLEKDIKVMKRTQRTVERTLANNEPRLSQDGQTDCSWK